MDYLESTSINQLEEMYKHEKNPKVKTKLLMVIHKKHGKTNEKIGEMTLTPMSTVRDQIRNFRDRGINGLRRRHGGGNPGYLTNNQKQKLIRYIETSTPTSREINTYIQNKFGKSYHPFSIPRLLRNMGFSRITPRKQHYKTDKLRQEEWKQVFKKRSQNTWIWVIRSSSRMNR